VERCPAADYVFQGRYAGAHLSTRMVELIVRKARNAAGLLKPVTGMGLRHAYAVHCLENGATIRELQEALGHASVDTTLRYQRCILPEGAISPLDRLPHRDGANRCPASTEALPPGGIPAPPAPAALFTQPLCTHPLELPFHYGKADAPAARFYATLRTRVAGRFLAMRARCRKPG